MITEYMILEAGDHPQMTKKVMEAIDHGWQPHGGIAAYTILQRDQTGAEWMEIWFMQAMIKESSK